MRVAIAENEALFRDGLTALLERAGVEVTGSCDDGAETLDIVHVDPPDVVILDIKMPKVDGLEAARQIREKYPEIGLFMLSQYSEIAYAVQILEEVGPERVGYRLKVGFSSVDVLRDALQRVCDGEAVMEPHMIGRLFKRTERTPLDELTDRELDVLRLMAEGRSNSGIAGHLHLSERTIEKYVTNVFMKLGLTDEQTDHRRVLAVIQYLRHR